MEILNVSSFSQLYIKLEQSRSLPANDGRLSIFPLVNTLGLTGFAVELGTAGGVFADQLLRYTAIKKLWSVDPFKVYPGWEDKGREFDPDFVFRLATKRLVVHGERSEIVRSESVAASSAFPREVLDFVYVDGNHKYQYVYEDICAWWPKLKVGGLMVLDDCCDVDESQRDIEGNVLLKSNKLDQTGRPESWGKYGVIKALRDFCNSNGMNYILRSGQGFVIK
jgi:hypothetical protein